jgi:hypothetical protein
VTVADVVIVSYNSRVHLRRAVAALEGDSAINVLVVDNASTDGCLETVQESTATILRNDMNAGFASACNRGWRAGSAPYVLFLNPDAAVDPTSVQTLAAVLDANPSAGIVAPRIVDECGRLDFSRRQFPRLRSTVAQALFLHRVAGTAGWADEVLRDPGGYELAGPAEWVSGACLLVRRVVLERVNGWDDGFFLYSEDIDLCRRTWDAGWSVLYEPAATAVHVGGESAPRGSLLPILAASRIRYAKKHERPLVAAADRIAIAVGELTHLVAGRGDEGRRAGHARALALALGLPDRLASARTTRTKLHPSHRSD